MTDPPAHFDLRTEPWVPVLDLSGAPAELGLREVLVRAHELRGVVDASPLVEVALHRLLLALLHRVDAGPRSAEDWQRLWVRGRLDGAAIDGYLGGLAGRFDLFAAERPFYQVRDLLGAGATARPIARLTHELASEGNAALLFDHTTNARFTPARAARVLVALQTFALGSLTTPPPGSRDRSSVDAPPARGAVCRVRGRTLFETLLANLVRYDPAVGVPVSGSVDDRPAWERPAPDGSTRQPTGYLDLLTWQTRRVELAPPAADGLIEAVAMVSGERVASGRELWALEPTMLAFVPSRAKAAAGALREVRLSANRALWRDSTVLLAAAGPGSSARRPGVIDWAAELAYSGYGDMASTGLIPLEAGGLVADQAKTLLWRRETLSVPSAALRDPAIVERIREALDLAERVGAVLGDGDLAVDAAGANLPRPLARIAMAMLGTPGRPPRPEAVRAFVREAGAAQRYWAALATHFALLLGELGAAAASADPDAELAAAVDRWREQVGSTARDAFVRATSGLGSGTRAVFAVADGERAFNGGMVRVLGRPRAATEVAPA